MADRSHPPRYRDGDFYTYLSQLRRLVFFSQQNAGEHFRVDRTRITRYENEEEPDDAPIGYIASILQLVAQRYDNDPEIQELLLADVNAAFHDRDAHIPFVNWAMVCDKADVYLEDQIQSYSEKWILKNFPKKRSKDEQINLLKERIGTPSYQEFVGMDTELSTLRQVLLTSGPPWIIVMVGLGGIGKTSLAHTLASDVIDNQLFDNVGWIQVRHPNSEFEKWRRAKQSETLDTETLLDKLLEQLAPMVYQNMGNATHTTAALLKMRLTEIPHLVIIDNVETLKGIDELFSELQSFTNPTKFLLTSRIDLLDEPTIYSYQLSGLNQADALALMRSEAALRNVPRISAASDAVLSDIYHAVGGNPLAIRLAVGQAISRPPDTILADLNQVAVGKTEAFFDFVFIDTWGKLSRRSRMILLTMLLSTNDGASLEYLTAITKLPLSTLSATLTQLSALSLVNSNNAATVEAERYTIHSLARTYLRHLLTSSAQEFMSYLHTTIAHSVRYMQQRIQRTEGILSVEDQEQALHTLRYGFEELRLWPIARPLLLALAPKMEQAGLREAWVSYLTRGIRFSKQLRDSAAEAELHFHLGTLHQRRSNYRNAYAEFSLAAKTFAALNQPKDQAKSLNGKAYVTRLQRNFDQAKSLANQALTLLDEDDTECAYSLLVLGTIQLDLRDFSGAEVLFQQSLAIWVTVQDHRMAAWCLTNLGAVLRPLQRYDEAIDAYQQAIKFFEEADDPVHLAVVWMNLGNIYLIQNNLKEALVWYEKSARCIQPGSRTTTIGSNSDEHGHGPLSTGTVGIG